MHTTRDIAHQFGAERHLQGNLVLIVSIAKLSEPALIRKGQPCIDPYTKVRSLDIQIFHP